MKHLNLTEQKGFVQFLALGAVLILAISLPVATKLVQKNQENRSHAASNDSACSAIQGKCLDRDTKVCSGNKQWYKGKCPGASNIQCCAPKNSVANNTATIKQDSKCINAGGVCKKITDTCTGSYLNGYCPSSGSDIKCCLSRKDPSVSITPTITATIKQDSKCINAGGTCKKTSDNCTGGNFLSGYCPSGASDVKCCVLTVTSGSVIQDSKCTNIGGTCQDSKLVCDNGKEYKSGYCTNSPDNIKCCASKFSGYSSKIVQSEACKKIYEGTGICMLIKDWKKLGVDMYGYDPNGDESKSCSEANNNNPNVICSAPARDECKKGSATCEEVGGLKEYAYACQKNSSGYLQMLYVEDCKSQGKKCKDGKCFSHCECVAFKNESDYKDITGKTLCQTGTPKDIKLYRSSYIWTCGDSSSCADATCSKSHPQGVIDLIDYY